MLPHSRRQELRVPSDSKPSGLPTPKSTASFWHSQPSSLLKGHRSTRDLPQTADVVVIGSGMTGTSAAHHLLTSGKGNVDVVLLEAREACWGATGRNGGHCQPLLVEHPNDPSIGLFELRNLYTLQRLIGQKSIDCEFVVQNSVHGIYSRRQVAELEQRLLAVKQISPELAAMMRLVTDRDSLHALRIPTALAACVCNRAARFWPYKFVSRILEDLVKSTSLSGTFNLQTLTPVESVTKLGSSVLVHTSRGSIRAKKVVLATNAYTSHLLHDFADLIVPCRGQMSALTPFPSVAGESRLKTSFGFAGDGLDEYLIQRPNESGGQLMFGGGRQHGPTMGITDDSVIDENIASYLRHQLVDVLNLPEGGEKEHSQMEATHEWTGIMGYSRDDHPWVGPVPDRRNVYIAAGYTGHGMPNAWLCGKAVATIVAETISGTSEETAMETASAEVGLPKSYRTSKDRYESVRKIDPVEVRDWADMQRGRENTQQSR